VRVLELPAEVAIGGVEARADGLAREAARAAEEAERLVLALLRGELLAPKAPRSAPPRKSRAA
jgi:hypothetical protein